MIDGNRDSSYIPETTDGLYWTINSGNNWKLQFFENDPKKFGIVYRYDNGRHEIAFANWLCVRMINVSVVRSVQRVIDFD